MRPALVVVVAWLAACDSKPSATPGSEQSGSAGSSSAPAPSVRAPSEPSRPSNPAPSGEACATVRVQLDGAKAFQLPTRAEYCLFTKDPVACCEKEGTSCAAFAGSAAPVFDIVRAPGCPEPENK